MEQNLSQNSAPIIGAWKLISFEGQRWNSEVVYPFGENPQGSIIYTESGHFSAQTILERDTDINHMLRKHLSSRVLWRRHSDWMLLQESLAKAANRLVKLGQVRIDKLAQEVGIQPTVC